jgi:AraC-like DNA-binding protein
MVRAHDQPSASLARSSSTAPENAAAHAPPDADPLSDVLRAVKLTGALFFLIEASRPWGVEVPPAGRYAAAILPRARHVISYHVMLRGSAWVSIPGVAACRFETGDVLVIAHGDPYLMLSSPDARPEFDAAATVDFLRAMAAGRLPFVSREGGGGSPASRYACGYLGCDLRPFNPMLATLPRLLRVPCAATGGGDLLDQLIALTLREARTPHAGGEAIRLRLSELIFVEVLRRHLAAMPARATGWLAALRDPQIGRVLVLLHGDPAHPWTLAGLADRAGMSRAALAARFAHLVGEPPMRYLALWRMQVAARLLADGADKVATVAQAVGYESEAAFSRAFRKAGGVSPAAWRRQAAGAG